MLVKQLDRNLLLPAEQSIDHSTMLQRRAIRFINQPMGEHLVASVRSCCTPILPLHENATQLFVAAGTAAGLLRE